MTKKNFFKLTCAFTMFSIIFLACGAPTELTYSPKQINPLPKNEEEKIYNISPMTTAVMPSQTQKESAAAVEMPKDALAPAPLQSNQPLNPPNQEPYWDNYFKNYGINPFIDTEDDHFSTFALDVDTGSYVITRRYINDGNLPPNDAVRVEEFVNYFEQGYDYPSKGKPFAIYVDGAPTQFTESEQYRILRIGIQGYAVPKEERKDASLVFVIDVSGSMDLENRLELVKDSLKLLVKQLTENDSVAIVIYGTDARVLLEPTSADQDNAILEAIYSLYPEGSTNAQAGLDLGYHMALKAFKPNGINRVILCSDGVANVGDTGADEIWDTIKAKASEGITLTTIGFGMGNYNDVLMEQLANQGNGFYTYVDSLNEAKKIFIENLTSTLQVIGLEAKLQVEFNPEVVSRYRLVGFENRAIADEDFRDDKVDAGEIGAGHSVTALYEIKLHPKAEGKIATVFLRWKDPETQETSELQQNFSSEDFETTFRDASPYFQRDVLIAEFAEVLRGSYWAQNSSFDAILETTESMQKDFDDDEEWGGFIELVEKANHTQTRVEEE